MKRRHFIAAAGGGLAWPLRPGVLSASLNAAYGTAPSDDFWELVRSMFLLDDDRIYLNVATLGIQPAPVVEAVVEHTRRVARSYPPATDWVGLRERLGSVLNADPAGIVITRNTTESMNFVANGLDLESGDEIVTTQHEHIGGLCCWELLAARRGLHLTQVPLPAPAATEDDLVQPMLDAVTSRTRVISVSHVLFTNGTIMPVARIAEFCRDRGILCVVDGAHPPGMMAVDVSAMGADFYASSPHKWLCAPQGTGLLWMAPRWRDTLWPTLASGGWNDGALGAQRLQHMGSLDESRVAGLDAALRFHDALGGPRVYDRIRQLRRHLAEGLASMPGVRIMSPPGDELAAGMVSFTVAGTTAPALQRHLAERANVRTRVVSEYDYGWMRLAPHVYNTMGELDTVLELVDAVTRSGL
ncbi:MAG TPA: aminotransferase class V-fold PLP-dependent enzyme [Longimicrobiales bacterium]|nr:aminotransferase class V-fold PLP-dependent enzyme [Longimicrobiales bacterium]